MTIRRGDQSQRPSQLRSPSPRGLGFLRRIHADIVSCTAPHPLEHGRRASTLPRHHAALRTRLTCLSCVRPVSALHREHLLLGPPPKATNTRVGQCPAQSDLGADVRPRSLRDAPHGARHVLQPRVLEYHSPAESVITREVLSCPSRWHIVNWRDIVLRRGFAPHTRPVW